VAIVDGLIAAAPAPGARRIDAAGLVLAPGLCDVHGDGFERNRSPRPGVVIDLDTGLIETDRQLVANGITTAWLAMTVSWEPGLRSLATAREIVAALARLRPRLCADIRLQLRWEIYALDAVEQIETWLGALDPAPVLAINDHMTGMLTGGRIAKKIDDYAKRAGLTPKEYIALTERAAARADEVPGAVARLTQAARAAGVPIFAHDEPDAAARAKNRALGITVSEFPLSKGAADAAIAAGEPTVLGAPNVLRGGSHIGALDAAPAVAAGLCSVLASDYYYPAPLQAAARLRRDGVAGLAQSWPLISANAAGACGLGDRGRIAPGQRADLVLLRDDGAALATVATFAAGRLAYLSDAGLL